MVHPTTRLQDQDGPDWPSLLVGRDEELNRLRDRLDAMLDGRGSLVVVGGEAGIGKTSLVDAIVREAAAQDILVLTGHCYDLTVTPPYGPWVDALRGSAAAETPEAARMLLQLYGVAEADGVRDQSELFERVWGFFTGLAASRPLVLILEDLHWADPASLDLLRFIARQVGRVPLLLVATYRDDELTRRHPLFQLMPAVVRETRAERITLRGFDAGTTREFVQVHCALPHGDETRLVDHLQRRGDGNPLFLSELLRTLEDEELLRPTATGWRVADLSRTRVPPLLRQLIEGRLGLLSAETRVALELAAVIGEETPLELWQTVGGYAPGALDAIVDESLETRMLRETSDSASLRFRHALVREAIYESVVLPRRRVWHLRVAETLGASPKSSPNTVAYHFQQAGDMRAVEWFVRAGLLARRAAAWFSAAESFEAAVALLEWDETRARERGWLRFEAGFLLRFSGDLRSIEHMNAAEQLALITDDPLLLAYSQYGRGAQRCMRGEVSRGLQDIEQGVAAIDSLLKSRHVPSTEEHALAVIQQLIRADEACDDTRESSQLEHTRNRPRVNQQRGVLINWLGHSGRYREAIAIGEPFVETAVTVFGDAHLRLPQCVNGHRGLGHAYAGLGQLEDARREYTIAKLGYRALSDYAIVQDTIWAELAMVVMPYETDNLAERSRLLMEAAEAWNRCLGVTIATAGEGSPSELQINLLEGRWSKAWQMATDHLTAPWIPNVQEGTVTLGILARHRGDSNHAWERIAQLLPHGPAIEPGDSYFAVAITGVALAAELALDAGELTLARRWIETHSRWLDWGGAWTWQTDNHLLWARLAALSNDPALARAHAERALKHASHPRQPLRLAIANRFLGRLDTQARQFETASVRLSESLMLTEACAASFERALTLLALAELHMATGKDVLARNRLGEVRAVCIPLNAAPTLAQVDGLETALAARSAAVPLYPDGLTRREVDVLRLIAAGKSNREIAENLFLSPRTVERHIANIYLKIDAHSKAAATAYALRNDIA